MIDKFGAILVLNDSRLPIPIAKQMSDFYAGMLNNMVIEVQQTAVSNKPTELEIVLSHEGRPKWKDPLLLYPRQIGPCLGSSQP